ncbi:hypothetical protein BDB00DRAFT_798509 [Zychaea mexicana]|uniref:uncharacterized protein n=1 Tax=Zychaea mexicana TaxID=64656 RepID=UPI0022FE056D|nr:uncharacterized protein BDB00DRAFT_798509 [Zychaea mexicana]KAI9498569.1 hypothetical protein BDB00DRAFT_798509 [Zychaea mexicana]
MSFELDSLSYALLASIFSAAAILSARNSRGPDIHPLLLNTQSDVSRVRYPGSSAVYRSRMYPNGAPLLSTIDRTIRTLRDFYQAAFEKHKSNVFAGKRDNKSFNWCNYDAIEKKSKQVYSGLVGTAGLQPLSDTESSFVGLYAANSPDTLAIQLGCHCGGLVTVPISAESTSSHLLHVLEKSHLSVLIVDDGLMDRVLSVLSGAKTSVRYLVVLGNVNAASKEAAEKLNIQVTGLKDVVAKGSQDPVEQSQPQNTNIASIYYTSNDHEGGKAGAVLTHKNIVSVIASYMAVIPPQQRITPKDRLMHNLPIDNVFGYVLTGLICVTGGSIAYGDEVGDGDVKVDVSSNLSAALEAKPTIYASGAPFLDQVKENIEKRYGNSFLFRRGMDRKQAYFADGRLVADSKYDMLVFRDIRQKTFGSNIRLLIIDNELQSGSLAPFFRTVLGTQVLKSLNRPETCGTTTLSMFYDYLADPASCGAPLPCNEVKLEDLPDRNMTSSDTPNPRGEVWIRGNNVFAGYWNDPEATEAVMDADGWFMTSVLGEMMPNGTLKIIGFK